MKRDWPLVGLPLRNAWRSSARRQLPFFSMFSSSKPGRWAYDFPVPGANGILSLPTVAPTLISHAFPGGPIRCPSRIDFEWSQVIGELAAGCA
jgi:hypothetical protein